MPNRNRRRKGRNGGRGRTRGNAFTTIRGRMQTTQSVSSIDCLGGNVPSIAFFSVAQLTGDELGPTQQFYIRSVRVSFILTIAPAVASLPGGAAQVAIRKANSGSNPTAYVNYVPSGTYRALSSQRPTVIGCTLTGAAQEVSYYGNDTHLLLAVNLVTLQPATYQLLISSTWELVRDTTLDAVTPVVVHMGHTDQS